MCIYILLSYYIGSVNDCVVTPDSVTFDEEGCARAVGTCWYDGMFDASEI